MRRMISIGSDSRGWTLEREGLGGGGGGPGLAPNKWRLEERTSGREGFIRPVQPAEPVQCIRAAWMVVGELPSEISKASTLRLPSG